MSAFSLSATNPSRKSPGGLVLGVANGATIPGDAVGVLEYLLFQGLPVAPPEGAIGSVWFKYAWRGQINPAHLTIGVTRSTTSSPTRAG